MLPLVCRRWYLSVWELCQSSWNGLHTSQWVCAYMGGSWDSMPQSPWESTRSWLLFVLAPKQDNFNLSLGKSLQLLISHKIVSVNVYGIACDKKWHFIEHPVNFIDGGVHGRRHRGAAGNVSPPPRFEISGGVSPQESRFLRKFSECLLIFLDFPIFPK